MFPVKPTITYLVNQTASEMQEQVTLTCEASGDPTPTINWSSSKRVFKEEEQVEALRLGPGPGPGGRRPWSHLASGPVMFR